MAPPPPVSISRHDIDAVRNHPRFRAAVEGYVAVNLARFRALAPVEHWMVSDMGRASLCGTIFVLDAAGALTPAALMVVGAVATGEVSRGRARLFLRWALANRLIERVEPGARLASDTKLAVTLRFHTVMADIFHVALEAAAMLVPQAAPALGRMADRTFAQQVSGRMGRIIGAQPELFPLTSPVQLFQARNGGLQILEDLILRQPAGRARLLERCPYSNSALARTGRCSRAHVIRLLQDAQARGLLSVEDRALAFAPEFSDAAETYYANLFAIVSAAAIRTLAKG